MPLRSDWFDHPRFQDANEGRGVIKRGERGDAVKTLQYALLELNHPLPVSTQKTGYPDGIFGSETDQAIRDFQRKALPREQPDGKVGPLTLGQLDQRLVGVAPPKTNSLIWGEAPPRIPGSPQEVDLGTILGWYPAVRQHHDMSCWAACLAFWGRYCGGGRPNLKQSRLIAMYSHLTSDDGQLMGGMPTSGIRSILTDTAQPQQLVDPAEQISPHWKAMFWSPFNPERLTYDWLRRNAGTAGRAVYLGYSIDGASHINVIGHYDLEGTSLVWAMEPWDGRFKLRDIDYYQGADRAFFAVPTN